MRFLFGNHRCGWMLLLFCTRENLPCAMDLERGLCMSQLIIQILSGVQKKNLTNMLLLAGGVVHLNTISCSHWIGGFYDAAPNPPADRRSHLGSALRRGASDFMVNGNGQVVFVLIMKFGLVWCCAVCAVV